MRCILVGNYGAGNVGDEALKDYFLAHYPEADWTVLSANPGQGEYSRLPAGIRSFFSFKWRSTLRLMRRSDALVFGGGSLFTDVELAHACFIWWLHVVVANACGLKVVFAFQGVGPFRTARGKWWAQHALNRADFLSVRDDESHERCAQLLKNKKCIQTVDPIFLTIHKSNSDSSKKVFVVIPRHSIYLSFEELFVEMSKKSSYDEIRVVSLQPDHPEEKMVLESLANLAGRPVTKVEARTLDDLVEACSDASFVLTQRYHGAIAALCLGRPVEIVVQNTADKLWALKEAVTRGTAEQEVQAFRVMAKAGENALKTWFITSRKTA